MRQRLARGTALSGYHHQFHPPSPCIACRAARRRARRLPRTAGRSHRAGPPARLTRTLGAERRTLIVVCADAQDVHQLARRSAGSTRPFVSVSFRIGRPPLRPFFATPDPGQRSSADPLCPGDHACDVMLVAATTATQRLAPRSYVAARTFSLEEGQRLDVDRLRQQMTLVGTPTSTQVVSQGDSRGPRRHHRHLPDRRHAAGTLDPFDDD